MKNELQILSRMRQLITAGDYFGENSDTEIAAAEEALGVRFPLSYRVFLRNFGAWLGPYEIAGLTPQRHTDPTPPYWSHIVDVTQMRRRASRGFIPNAYIPVSSDGADYSIYLDTAQMNVKDECPVIVLGPGVDGVVVAELFCFSRIWTPAPFGLA